MEDLHIQDFTFMYMFHIYKGLFFVYVAIFFALHCICRGVKKIYNAHTDQRKSVCALKKYVRMKKEFVSLHLLRQKVQRRSS